MQIDNTTFFASGTNYTIFVNSITLDEVNVTNTSIQFSNLTSLGSTFTNTNATYDAVASFIGLDIGLTVRNINTSTNLFSSTSGDQDYNATFSPGQVLSITITEVTSSTTSFSGGGSGFGCSSGYEELNGICVEIEEIPEEGAPPSQLFDITFSLDDFIISNSNELSAVVTFESFGTVPTPVELTFIILDSSGNEIYSEESSITVTTEEVLRWNYETLGDLLEGNYVAVLSTLYNTDVSDEFRQDFEIGVGGLTGVWFWIGLGVVGVFVIGLIWKLARGKKETKVRESWKNQQKINLVGKGIWRTKKINRSQKELNEISKKLKRR